MKKFLCVLLVLASIFVCAFGAAACSESGSSSSNPDLSGWGDL